MDRNFRRALSLVLTSEGGWSDNPADPGGATMKGVTLANFRRYVKPGGSKADLRDITDDQLAVVYRHFYWDAIAGDQLPDGVDYTVFDFAVTSGPGRAARYLQAVLGVAQDGTIGPATIAAAAAKPSGFIIDHVCDARLAFLEKLPTWPDFGRGWSARVESVRTEALKMMAQTVQPAAPVPVPPVPAPKPPVAPPAPSAAASKPPAPAGRVAGIAAILALAAMAVSGWWHSLVTFVQGLIP